jgi:hypothetical protein
MVAHLYYRMYLADCGSVTILLYPLSPLPSKQQDIKMYVLLVDAKVFQSGIRHIKAAGKDGFSHDMSYHHNAPHLLVIASAGIAGDLPFVYRGFGINVKTI